MREINLLDSLPTPSRSLAVRAEVTVAQREEARQFGESYFDGTREQGYGGYRYDGRWIPVAKRLIGEYQIKPGDRVLDIGCAKGFLLHDLRCLRPGVRVYGIDVSRYALDRVMSCLMWEVWGEELQMGSAISLPWDDGTFDVVLSINTLHNLERADCAKAIQEIERVKAPGGHSYIQVDSWLNNRQCENLARWNLTARTLLDPDGWRRLFAEAGYTGDYSWTLIE